MSSRSIYSRKKGGALDHPVELDFPCSWSYRQWEAEQNGEELPDIDVPRQGELQLPEPPLGRGYYYRLFDKIEQIEASINYLEGKINEHIEASKRKKRGSW